MRMANDGNDHQQLNYGEAPGRFQSRHAIERVKPDILWEQAFSCVKASRLREK